MGGSLNIHYQLVLYDTDFDFSCIPKKVQISLSMQRSASSKFQFLGLVYFTPYMSL